MQSNIQSRKLRAIPINYDMNIVSDFDAIHNKQTPC